MSSNLLASDDNNTDFAGARDPDAALSVIFYRKVDKDNFQTEKLGKPVFFEADYVKIFTPGNQLNIVDTAVREDHKKRFPKQWAYYQSRQGDSREEANGTPLAQWTQITQSQAEELRVRKFYTVESVANASDIALQSIGMIAGMSPHSFRDSAKRFLMIASGMADAKAAEDKAAEMKAQNEALQAQIAASNEAMAKMQEQMAALAAAQATSLQTPEKRKPGRPKKAETA